MTPNSSLRPAVFLDRDGVLNVDSGYVGHPSQVKIIPGVADALKLLSEHGFLLIMISNQSGIARGFFDENAVHACNQTLTAQIIAGGGAPLDLMLFCPHHPEGVIEAYRQTCTCRKPEPGLIKQASQTIPIDLSRSFMVGDKPDDIECAMRAGVRGIQVHYPHVTTHSQAWAVVDSLWHAVPLIMASTGMSASAPSIP